MNIKLSQSLAAVTLVAAGLAQPVFAETLGEHPAVLVQKNWNNRGIDTNTFIVAHPARLTLLAASPTAQANTYASNENRDPAERVDAHAQAAALLSRPQAIGVVNSATTTRYLVVDTTTGVAQASAAALLTGVPFNRKFVSSATVRTESRQVSLDAQAQAAALLSGLPASSDPQLATRTRIAASTDGQAL
jgi:hypothetical protein